MENKRWFNAKVTGIDQLNSIILKAKVGKDERTTQLFRQERK
jgi:hypothetical protein